MNGLTRRQGEILDFLSRFLRGNGYPPTIREIREEFGLKSNRGVVDHLRALERKGCIRRSHGSSRAIEILRHGESEGSSGDIFDKTLRYPVAGRITAGRPATPIEDIEGTLVLDEKLFRQAGDFILEVKGDSMIEDHIVPGDLLVVKRVQTCRNGEIVVAMVDGEATVKRYFRREGKVFLEPANRKYESVVFSGDDSRICSIVGRVLGVIRRFGSGKVPFSG